MQFSMIQASKSLPETLRHIRLQQSADRVRLKTHTILEDVLTERESITKLKKIHGHTQTDEQGQSRQQRQSVCTCERAIHLRVSTDSDFPVLVGLELPKSGSEL